MSTKNLARTVIEGGRTGYSKGARHSSHGVERSKAHQLELALARGRDPESAVFEPLERVYRSFDDKLGPARRWLRSQVGRPWDKVRGELFARFDPRTTAGRHILYCHLLREVQAYGDESARYADYAVSRHGILEHRPRSRYHYRAWVRARRLPEPEAVLRRWLAARRVMAYGERLFWLMPTPGGAYRQHLELSPKEAQRFRALPEYFRAELEGPARVPGAL
jgi:hypothetical protein